MQVLDTYGTVTLNSAGAGTVTMAPDSFRVWRVTMMNVRTTQTPTQTPVPQCTVYLGAQGHGNIISQTWMGNRSTATGSLLVQPSQPLIFMWENGIAGSVATASVYGSMEMR